MLAGQELIQEETGEIAALLGPLARQDKVLGHYLGSASDWASVSPVVLPGYDDPAHYRRRLAKGKVSAKDQRRLLDTLHRRTEKLLRKAIRDAGFPDELAAHADLDWRDAGFWPGTERAGGYTVPDHLTRFPRLHVRLRWRAVTGQPVCISGPICLGGGRFYGLGLFAACLNTGSANWWTREHRTQDEIVV
jgi:CRISPR-associated protein Csb2